MTIVGTATFGAVEGIPGFTVVAADDATAQAMFAQPGSYDAIVVASDGSSTNDELATAVQAAVGSDDLEIVTGDADTADKQATFKEDMSFFNTFLMAFAYVALFVGMFIIYNTFSIIIAQRMREMAMLRAVGASRRQVLRAVLLESAIVGLVASAVGLAAGVGMSFALRGLLGAVGLEIPSGDVVITSGTVMTAFVVGVSVTLLSSVGPALRASRIKPIAALRDTAIEDTTASLKRTVLGLAIAGGGAVAFAGGIAGSGPGALQLLGVGVLLLIFGMFVLAPVIARPVMRVLGFPTKVSGATGHLAGGERSSQPPAHGGHGVGADDRCRPRRLHHHRGQLHQGLHRRGRRHLTAGRLRRRLRVVGQRRLRHHHRRRPRIACPTSRSSRPCGPRR